MNRPALVNEIEEQSAWMRSFAYFLQNRNDYEADFIEAVVVEAKSTTKKLRLLRSRL